MSSPAGMPRRRLAAAPAWGYSAVQPAGPSSDLSGPPHRPAREKVSSVRNPLTEIKTTPEMHDFLLALLGKIPDLPGLLHPQARYRTGHQHLLHQKVSFTAHILAVFPLQVPHIVLQYAIPFFYHTNTSRTWQLIAVLDEL